MTQSRGSSGFALKALQGLPVSGKLFRKKLQRNVASQPLILGAVNHPHATLAQGFQNPVMRDGFSEHVSLFRGTAGLLVGSRLAFKSQFFLAQISPANLTSRPSVFASESTSASMTTRPVRHWRVVYRSRLGF